jgi:glycosyltransferase involved in cell wall biosynthesis
MAPDAQNEPVLVTIVTVVLNGRRFVESAIRSVLEQSYPWIEYVVIDGGSTDGSIELIQRYETRLDTFVTEPDSGVYDAMNKGIRRSRGQLIGILNSDDWYAPDAVHTAVEAWRERPDAGIIHGRMAIHEADEQLVRVVGHRNWPLIRLLATPFKHPATFVTRATYDEIGMYDDSLRIAADYDFMLRSIRRGIRSVHVPSIFTHVRRVGLTTGVRGVVAPREITEVLTRHLGRERFARYLVRARHWRVGAPSPMD